MPHRKMIHLVDDDEAIRHSASFMLRGAGYRVQTHIDGVSFLDAVATAERGCILLDVQMPQMDGLQVLGALVERGIDMPVIVLTGHGDVSVAVQAMKLGAMDFVEKPYEKALLLASLEAAFTRYQDQEPREKIAKDAINRIGKLTDRERDILEGLVEGLTNKAIAQRHEISPRTVEIHRANVMEKLEVNSLSAALRLAFSAGLGFD